MSNFKCQISNVKWKSIGNCKLDIGIIGHSQRGQSLTELMVVLSVVIVIVGALTFITIATLRNAEFSKNQAQATKLAQEAIENVRVARDRNSGFSSFTLNGTPVTDWQPSSALWTRISTSSCNPCYFRMSGSGVMTSIGTSPTQGEKLPASKPIFNRVIVISDGPNFATEKIVTAVVSWTDFSGTHESKLTTILRKI